jgi:hypothetical protein
MTCSRLNKRDHTAPHRTAQYRIASLLVQSTIAICRSACEGLDRFGKERKGVGPVVVVELDCQWFLRHDHLFDIFPCV